MLLCKTCFFISCDKIKKTTVKNNKLKPIASMWNDVFQLPDGSYALSGIQDYIAYIKNMKITYQLPYSHLHQQD